MAMKRLYLFGVLMLAILIGSSGSFAADSGRIVIISKALSWFEVYDSIGDKSLVDAVFDVGERYEVPDLPGLRLSTGNAGALEIQVDGKVVPPIGPVGSIRRHVMLDAEKLRAGPAKDLHVQIAAVPVDETTKQKQVEAAVCDTIEARSAGKYWSYDPTDAYEFGLKIQQIVREGDLQAMFGLVKEEIGNGPRKSAVQGRSFSEVFSEDWRNSVLSEKPDCEPVGWRGFMLGYGNIWYRQNSETDEWEIISISGAKVLKKACPALWRWTGLPKQSVGYSLDKEFLLSAETDPKTEDIHVKLKSVKSGKTKILETMEHQNFGSLGSRDEGIMKNRVQFSKQGSLAAVSGASASNVSLFDTTNWKKVLSFGYAAFSLSPNGKYLAVAGFGWKFGWELSIFEIVNKGKGFFIGGKRRISGTPGCGTSSANVCVANVAGGSEWYLGQEFKFSEDSDYLIIDALDENYIAYDMRKSSLKEQSCAL